VKNRRLKIRKLIRESAAAFRRMLMPAFLETVARMADLIIEALGSGRRIYFCGNGGSAADSQHLAAEFVGRFQLERQGLPAISLTTDTSILTSIGNDYGFEKVFSRQVEALGRQGDILFIFSTSGKSTNLLLAAREAREKGLKVLALVGKDGGPLKSLADVPLIVPGGTTARIQEGQILVGHILAELAESELCGPESVVRKTPALLTDKIKTRAQIAPLVKNLKAAGRKIVFTNGCFDLFHHGHLKSLSKAASYGDVLVVGLNSDRSVRKLKGPGRPVFPQRERAEMLAALQVVDYVVIFGEDTPAGLIAAVVPDVLVKGADYGLKDVVGRETVEKAGGKIVLLPLIPNRSTSVLIKTIRQNP